MRERHVKIVRLRNGGDERGYSYEISKEAFDDIGKIEDVHIASIESGRIRGNHYHVDKKEVIIILYSDSFIVAWESSDGRVGEKKEVSGRGCVRVEINKNVSHAIHNIGKSPIYILVFSADRYDPNDSGTVVKKII